jgi:hypothetical protein
MDARKNTIKAVSLRLARGSQPKRPRSFKIGAYVQMCDLL